jgi:cobalt-zinc-cadmium efflux system protein
MHGGHDHSHSHARTGFGAAFAIGAAFNAALVLAQFAFGYLSNSLALISDGVHNLGDVIGLLLARGASWAGQRLPTARRTYGYGRASILAALANAALLLVATGPS